MAGNPYDPYEPYNPYDPKKQQGPYQTPGGNAYQTMMPDQGDVPLPSSGQTPAGGGTPSAPSGGSDFDPSKVPAGVPIDWARDFISRNPGDYDRLASAYGSGGSSQGAGTSPYTSGAGGGYGQTTAFQDSIRQILMQQLGALGQTPTVDDPGIRENLAGRRLALQRSAERQRSAAAESLAGGGLATSGAAQTARGGIEQQRGEAEAQGVGQVLGAEVNQRRQALMQLLGVAIQSGDAEAARIIQKQMQDDALAYNYTALQQSGNLQALMDILNAA